MGSVERDPIFSKKVADKNFSIIFAPLNNSKREHMNFAANYFGFYFYFYFSKNRPGLCG